MAINIKNDEVESLAREVASQTKESLTDAIRHSLQERLERLRGRRRAPDLVEELMEISRRCGALEDIDSRSAEEILGYDAQGLLR
jgi:antitoxin VapB